MQPAQGGMILNQRYQIIKSLGQGGFGAVYLAWDRVLERNCAIKESLDASTDAQRQFKREAKMLANLAHPNLPRVTDYFSIPDQGQYLVMDYVEGEDLWQMIERLGQALPEGQVIQWTAQICDALTYLHTQNPAIIHRDIKPANIKITPAGKAVLVDFGIAKVYDPKLSTTMGAKAVTAGYSPPEQYGASATDARSDIYSLGATLYTLLTGQILPPSVDMVAEISKPAALTQLNPQVSPALSGVVERATQLSRTARFSSSAEFKTALLQIGPPSNTVWVAGAKPVPAVSQPYTASRHPASKPLPHPTTAARKRRKKPGWVLAAAFAGIVFGSLVVALLAGRVLLRGMNIPQKPPSSIGLAELPTATLTPASTERAALSLPTFTPTIIPTILQLDATASSQPVGMISGNPAPAWILDNHLVPMAYIAAGPFEMGSDSGEANQKPVHRVDLEAFYIDRYEVTNSHYAECVAAGACEPPLDNQSKKRPNYYGNPSYADYPVIFITWQMATTYCDWRGGRLPTEAEWEKAARGGLEGSAYPWGNTAPICEAGKSNGANYDDDAKCNDIDTAAVGSYAPNGAGLYDMAGNVWEWVEDWYAAEYYRTSPQANPQGPDSGEYRVLRGGSFGSDKDHQQVSFRNYYDPLRRSYAFGFRCVRDVDALADFRPVDTPTPVAEAARTLEPTPTPGLKAAIAASSVNVRYGPGVDYPVIQYAYSGDEFVAVGRSADSSWLIVQIGDDLAGWIALSTVSFPYKVTVLPVLQAISAEKVKARLAGEDPAEISAGGSGSSGGGAYWWNIHP